MISHFLFVFVALVAKEVVGHGMMLQPVNRASRWRFDPTAPIDYDDNQSFCGGAYVHHSINGGRCGVCGDPYSEPHPRAHENTGTYGKGVFVAIYQPGSIVEIIIRLTANHLGHFTYSLCVLEDPSAPESGEDCFIPLTLKDGSKQYSVTSTDFYVTNYVKLPEITCEHCVLRWTYTAGNSWGQCLDGTHAVGCGPQETFRSCADVAIL